MAKPYSFEPRREGAANYNMYSNTTKQSTCDAMFTIIVNIDEVATLR